MADQTEQAAPVDWQATAKQRERELKTVGEARHRAEQELARLHEGEETTEGHDPAVMYTNGQWLYRFNRDDPAERLQVIEALRREAARGSNCFLMAHEKRLSEPSQTAVNKSADCADIVFSRHQGRGITIDTAPTHTRIHLTALLDRYAYLHMPTPDTIAFADQVLYRVTGYTEGALELELVEDWRPAPTVQLPLTDEQAAEIKTRWKEK